jgi:hypothetical protein
MRRGTVIVLLAAVAVSGGCGAKKFPYSELGRPAARIFPSPPPGAVVFSRQDRGRVLALGVLPERAGVFARVSVLGQQGLGVRGLHVRVAAGGAARTAAPCGPGCYQARLPVAAPRSVEVAVAGPERTTPWRVLLPARWPSPAATKLMRRAERVWRRLRSVTIRDRLASDATHAVTTTWRMVAPDRVAYDVEGGGSAVIIGGRRWDRQAGGVWTLSTQSPVLRQPVPFWVGVSNAHLLGSTAIDGRPAWRVSFYDPRSPAWFEVAIEKRTGHTLDLRMNAAAHFMHERYGSFDEPLRILPPR